VANLDLHTLSDVNVIGVDGSMEHSLHPKENNDLQDFVHYYLRFDLVQALSHIYESLKGAVGTQLDEAVEVFGVFCKLLEFHDVGMFELLH
jgi:hypothetical protein